MAKTSKGAFFLRLDDLDQTRSRSVWAEQIKDDLQWLGVSWTGQVWQQSDRLPRYRSALQVLWNKGLLYPCFCSRADIRAAVAAPQEGAPLHGPDGLIYPGTCRPDKPPTGPLPDSALRLNMALALEQVTGPICFTETGGGQSRLITPEDMVTKVGDVALARPGMGAAYHLAIVCDDADQEVSHIVRGQDLFEATQIHVLLQHLLGYATPIYHHHRLIRDENGKRLAKRDDARSIATYRSSGKTPQDIRVLVGL